jgi:hypothetical protein
VPAMWLTLLKSLLLSMGHPFNKGLIINCTLLRWSSPNDSIGDTV